MPRKSFKRRYKRKRKRSGLQSMTVRQPGSCVPDLLRTRLRYNESLQLAPGITTGSYWYRINSLFDPNYTGTGHQPYGFDQLAVFYNRYKVRGVSWKVIASGTNTDLNLTIVPFNNATGFSNQQTSSEAPYAVNDVLAAESAGAGTKRIYKGYISMKKLMGRTILDDRDEAVITTNPSEIAMLGINYASSDGVTTISNLNFFVELTYYCELFDKIPVVGS